MKFGKAESCVVALFLLLSLAGLVVIPGSEKASSYSLHDPIVIFGDSGFTNASGVVWGSGTASDPYVIEGWEIDTSSGTGMTITRTIAHFVIRNVFIHGGGTSYGSDGIRMEYVSNGTVTACDFSNNWDSVFMSSCVDMIVSNCNVSSSLIGLSVFQWCSRITLEGNHMWENQLGGVYILDARDITLTSNVFENDGITITGEVPDDFSTHTIPESNTVNGLPVRYVRNQVGLEVDGVPTGQMIIANCSDLTIHGIGALNTIRGMAAHYVSDSSFIDNTLRGSKIGFYLDHCQNVTVSRINASENSDQGVLLDLCSNCSVLDSMFVANEDGVVGQNSRDLLFSNNSCMLNTRDGIGLVGGLRLLVSKNRIVGNMDGMSAMSARNSKCIENDFQANSFSGVETYLCQDLLIAKNNISGSDHNGVIDYESSNTAVLYNNISNNLIVFQIYNSNNLTIHHNNMAVSPGDVFYITGGDNTRWNDSYPSGGNYWSDYNGPDEKSGPNQDLPGPDDIGDIPYVIEASNQDWYPLMDPVFLPTNSPPRSLFVVSPASGDTSTDFVFDASPCWDIEDFSSTLEVRWDWNGDGIWDTGWSTDKVVMHNFSSQGTYDVTLEVRDRGGLTNRTAVQVEIAEEIPEFGMMPLVVIALLVAVLLTREAGRRKAR